jgi:hypothetical protein
MQKREMSIYRMKLFEVKDTAFWYLYFCIDELVVSSNDVYLTNSFSIAERDQ